MRSRSFVDRTRVVRRGCDRGPFSIAGHLPGGRVAYDLIAPVLDRLLGLSRLQALYDGNPRRDGESFVARALRVLDVSVDWTGAPHGIPASGGLLVVANHPTGPLDGLALLSILQRVRTDVKVLGSYLLGSIPELRELLVDVDPFASRSARHSNIRGLRAAIRWLSGGGCLLAFPSGEVAHRSSSPDVALDASWRAHLGALGVKTGADVLPVFIAGRNRLAFRHAGLVHRFLRTALLPRELYARRGSRVRVIVGERIPISTLARLPDADQIAYLRTRTYLLSHRIVRRVETVSTEIGPRIPVASAGDAESLTRDVEALTAEHLLVAGGTLRVYCAPAPALPHVLPEIGRLRELTFRAAGEGTGRARDLDVFDAYYHHLFAWDPRAYRIVGAYRLGLTGEILPTRGAGGLYTSTLFDYDARLLSEIGPSIELGRSFVRQEEQRGYAALLALWRGIATFIAKHPEYRCVFGAVSISSRYQSLSRELLVRFLSSAALRSSAARLVRSRRPLPAGPAHRHVIESATVTSLESVSSLLEAIEPDGKSVPVLLRQYLNLNARLLGFSVDPAFGDALDGLMIANLTEVPRQMLQRLMGKSEADAFLAHHAAASRSSRLRSRLGRVFHPAGAG